MLAHLIFFVFNNRPEISDERSLSPVVDCDAAIPGKRHGRRHVFHQSANGLLKQRRHLRRQRRLKRRQRITAERRDKKSRSSRPERSLDRTHLGHFQRAGHQRLVSQNFAERRVPDSGWQVFPVFGQGSQGQAVLGGKALRRGRKHKWVQVFIYVIVKNWRRLLWGIFTIYDW